MSLSQEGVVYEDTEATGVSDSPEVRPGSQGYVCPEVQG